MTHLRLAIHALLLPAVLSLPPLPAQTAGARQELNSYLANLGTSQLKQRSQAISPIHTRADAERRQAQVRQTILALIGGLTEHHGPVRVKEYGVVQDEGFRIEKIAYESLPDFWVTANVYAPTSSRGKFPAVILSPRHGPGKESQASWAANLARNGILVDGRRCPRRR